MILQLINAFSIVFIFDRVKEYSHAIHIIRSFFLHPHPLTHFNYHHFTSRIKWFSSKKF
jgi:hypothetical protein